MAAVQAFGVRLANDEPERFTELCGEGVDCGANGRSVWKDVQSAAEAADDDSAACTFTAFTVRGSAPRASRTCTNVIFATRWFQTPHLVLRETDPGDVGPTR